MTQPVLIQKRESIFEITLNRPEKHNAVNMDLLEGIDKAVSEATTTPGIRVVFVRGAGKSFSSGIDPEQLMSLAALYGPDWKQKTRTATADAQAVLNNLERLELPTICLIHGFCLGLGMEIALACDLRIATETAVLGFPETRLGMIPDVGGTTRLTRLVGPARAKELIMTGRRFKPSLAEAWGIVNYVVPKDGLDEKAMELTEEISKAAPLAVGMAKRVIDSYTDIQSSLDLEGWAQSQLFNTEDFEAGVKAFGGDPPEFKGR